MSAQERQDVDEFLEHVGVKGMHWGKRTGVTVKGRRGDFKSRSAGQKALLIGGGYAGFAAGSVVAGKILRGNHPVVGLIGAVVATKAGVRATRHILDAHKTTPVSSLPN